MKLSKGLFAFAFFSLLLISCKSTPKGEAPVVSNAQVKATVTDVVETPESEPVDTQSVAIKVPEHKAPSYFSGISNSVLAQVENGSPSSLRSAANSLRKAALEYSENEKVLLNVASEIMTIVWKSEKVDWDVPAVTEKTSYLGAISSVNNGVYDSSTGNTDFLTMVLPSLLLATSNPRTDYFDESFTALSQALKLKPNSVLGNYLMGLLLKKQRKYDEALKFFEKAIQEKEMCFEVQYEKANCLIALNRNDEVATVTDKLLVQYPSNVQVFKLCAVSAYNLKDYSNAERYASQVLQQNPADLEFILFRAKIFIATGDYLKASSLLDVYARSNKNNRDYLLLRATVQKLWNKNYDAASQTIENAISLYPNDSDIILFAAELASETGIKINGKDGGQFANEILQKDPNNSKALLFSINNLVKEKKYQEAYNSSLKLIEEDTKSIESVCTHILICLKINKQDEAWKLISDLYAKNSSDEKVVQTYIEVMISTERTAQALRLINSMIPDASSSMKSFLFYERSFISGSETARLSDLRSSLMSNPRNRDALFRMYTIYFNKRDYRKAQYYIKQVVALDPNDAESLRLNSELEKLID